ncbi:MAG TPA: hemerythrin domain-containing protein [Burkholderiales bacterium]|jgi:hemerythrin-like domain-containing protein|nr:hemerythrin domain-containing protein [Burkholderiales bacterium]
MIDPIVAWHEEHVYFGRLLALLKRELDVFHTGARPNYELMLDVLSYLQDYADQYHHPREDEAFTRLARKCPDLELEIARLKQEHRVIKRSGEMLREYLDEALEGALMRRSDVEVAAATYLVYYGNHIAKEEEDIVTRAAKTLTTEDWAAVRDVAPAGQDPVFGAKPQDRYRELRRRIALEA